MLLRAFLTHSITYGLPWPISSFLGIIGPFPFLGHPQPILILHSHELLLNLLGFPSPITISFTFRVHGLSITPYSLNSLLRASLAYSCLLSISYNAHGFTTSFPRLPQARLLPLRPIYYFLGL